MSKKIFEAVGISFALRLVNMSLGVLLTPLLFRIMGKEELTGWYIVVGNMSLLGLFDFGLIPTLHRRIALTYGKLTVAKTQRRIAYLNKRMRIFFSTGKRLFEIRGWLTLVISMTAGFLYLQTLHLGADVKNEILLGWAVVSVSQGIQIRGSIWPAFLLTTGNAALETGVTIIISTIDLAFRFLVVFLGGGIVGLALVAGISIIARRVVCAYFVRRRLPDWFSAPEPFSRVLVASMTRPMVSAWLVGVGAFLLLRTDQYFIVGTQDPTLLPPYQGAYQIFASLSQFALITSGSAGVFLSHYWAAGQYELFRNTVAICLKVGMAILWFGVATLMAIGSSFFTLWLGPGNFVGYGLLAAFSITIIVDAQQTMLVSADRATEHEVYGKWLIACGIANVAITYVLNKYFGLIGIAISTSIALLLTSVWVSALNTQRRLGIGILTTVVPIQLRTAALATCLFGMLKVIVWGLGPERVTPIVGTALGLSAGPAALSAWLWFGVCTKAQRTKILRYFRTQAELFLSNKN